MIPLLILIVALLIFCFILTVWTIKEDEVALGALVYAVCISASIAVVLVEAYKMGQVDALTGKVKYELKTNADSTKTWELK